MTMLDQHTALGLVARLQETGPTPDEKGVAAADMAAMRMQAQALAFHWFCARDFEAHPQGFAYYLFRPRDFSFKPTSMNGLRIRVALSFEQDRGFGDD